MLFYFTHKTPVTVNLNSFEPFIGNEIELLSIKVSKNFLIRAKLIPITRWTLHQTMYQFTLGTSGMSLKCKG